MCAPSFHGPRSRPHPGPSSRAAISSSVTLRLPLSRKCPAWWDAFGCGSQQATWSCQIDSSSMGLATSRATVRGYTSGQLAWETSSPKMIGDEGDDHPLTYRPGSDLGRAVSQWEMLLQPGCRGAKNRFTHDTVEHPDGWGCQFAQLTGTEWGCRKVMAVWAPASWFLAMTCRRALRLAASAISDMAKNAVQKNQKIQ